MNYTSEKHHNLGVTVYYSLSGWLNDHLAMKKIVVKIFESVRVAWS